MAHIDSKGDARQQSIADYINEKDIKQFFGGREAL